MRWLYLFLLLTLSAVVSSCGLHPQPPHDGGSISIRGQELYWAQEDFPLWLLIDDRLPGVHTQATIESALLWNQVVGVQVFEPVVFDFSLTPPTSKGMVVVSIRDLGQSDNGNRRLGLARAVIQDNTTHMSASEVWFDTDLDEAVLLVVMIHELGHSLTLDHDNDCGSIMHPTVINCGGQYWITPEDIQRVRNMALGTRDVDERQLRMDFLPEPWRDSRCTH